MKKYKLLKDLPSTKKGDVFTFDGGVCTPMFYHAGTGARFTQEFVENTPEIFELINDRIEVSLRLGDLWNGKCERVDVLIMPPLNPYTVESKLALIKQAIEKILNEDDGCVFDAEKINAQIDKLKAMEDAFNESRLTHPMVGFKHDTFQDYLNSLTQQNKDQ